MKFSADYRVDTHNTDLNGNASLTAIMQYIQESANLQHEAYGPTLPDLRSQGKAFILSRCALDIYLPLRAQDRVRVTTWLSEAKGYGYLRHSILNRGEEKIAAMTAFWGVIDIPTRRLLKADSVELGFGSCSDELIISSPARFRIPKELQLEKVGEHRVVYGDCDENVHLNNTKYPEIFCGLLPTMIGKRVKEFSISYQNEAVLSSAFSVFRGEADGVCYFKTLLDDGRVGAEARMVLE